MKDLIKAIYEDDFEAINIILDGREELIQEDIMQTTKIHEEAELLSCNESFYSWVMKQTNIKSACADTEEEWNIFCINENDSGEIRSKFIQIISSGKMRLLSMKYLASSSKSETQADTEYNLTDLRYIKPIHLAAMLGDLAPIQSLLQNGADIYEPDSKGLTPLHYGIITGNNSVVAILSACSDFESSNIDYKYQEAMSPLELAASLGRGRYF